MCEHRARRAGNPVSSQTWRTSVEQRANDHFGRLQNVVHFGDDEQVKSLEFVALELFQDGASVSV
jgi:hypothetical protein